LRSRPRKKSRLKKAVKILGLVMVLVLLLYPGLRLYQIAYQAYYDAKPAPVTFSVEDITEFVDSNQDARVTPAESPLKEAMASKLQQAQVEEKRIFIAIGHLNWDQWWKFESLDDMVLYCKLDHGFRNVNVEKSFYDIERPTYCMVGFGGYAEIDPQGGLKSLWIYRTDRSRLAHTIPNTLTLGLYNVDEWKLGAFVDKHFVWQRIPSPVLKTRLDDESAARKADSREKDQATTPTFFDGHNLGEQFRYFKSWKMGKMDLPHVITLVEHSFDDRSVSDAERLQLGGILDDLRAAEDSSALHIALMKHVARIRENPSEFRWVRHELEGLLATACAQLMNAPASKTAPAYVEDALFTYACLKTRQTRNAVEVLEALDRLEREFPESRYLPSAHPYKADACIKLAQDAHMGSASYNVSAEAAIGYYTSAFEEIDKAIASTLRLGDQPLQGIPFGFAPSESMLQDSMFNESLLRSAVMMRTRIASQISERKIEIKYGTPLYRYLNGDLGPELLVNPAGAEKDAHPSKNPSERLRNLAERLSP